MMAPKKVGRTRVRWIQNKRAHVKLANLSEKGDRRYNIAVNRFFVWLDAEGHPIPNTFDELDFVAGEFINSLYLADAPLYWGGDFCSGLKRLYAGCAAHIPTVAKYYCNWERSTLKKRAIPLSPDLLRGMVCYLFVINEPGLALGFLLGFLSLLRIDEILSLSAKQIQLTSSGWAILIFTESKGAKLKGEPETVVVKDAGVVSALSRWIAASHRDQQLCSCSYRKASSLLKDAARHFGLVSRRVTSHGLRRGGATWHFSLYGSYDRTAGHGRWRSVPSARKYIDQAVSELHESGLPVWGKERLADCLPLWDHFLSSAL